MYNINDIENLIINFKNENEKDTYDTIMDWYNQNKDYNYDIRIKAIYMFLLGANIKNKFYELSYDDHMKYIKIIREHIDDPRLNQMERLTRKTYLEYGTKSY